MINLLQCRPLKVFMDSGEITIPEELPDEQILISSEHASMGLSRKLALDYIVYVDPEEYYHLPYNEKNSVARVVGSINWKYRGSGNHMMLMVPGRIGTSSPELGVPVSFADISHFEALCEITASEIGFNPELSYGSHIFQDLVEAQILYMAVFPGDKTLHYHPELIRSLPNRISGIPGGEKRQDIVYLADVSGQCRLYHDLSAGHILLHL